MKVTMRNYQPSAGAAPYKKQTSTFVKDEESSMDAMTQAGTGRKGDIDEEQAGLVWNLMDKEEQDSSLSALLEQAKESLILKYPSPCRMTRMGSLQPSLQGQSRRWTWFRYPPRQCGR